MSQQNFIDTQLSFSRVASAASVYDSSLKQLFAKSNINFPPKHLYIRAFKKEQVVEVWASDNTEYTFIKSYAFAANSGNLGPKQKEGDLQIPEGFYHILSFNPVSNFHLSFKINYPNAADSIRNKLHKKLGDDIFIHGNNKTIGCIPIGDKNIAELYWLCIKTYSINQNIPVHIFPFKMENENSNSMFKVYASWISLWNSMKPMYQFFKTHKILGEVVGSDSSGNYKLSIPWD